MHVEREGTDSTEGAALNYPPRKEKETYNAMQAFNGEQ